MGDSTKKLSTKLSPRNVNFMKPRGYEDWLTINELSLRVSKDISWLRRLERDKRIPKARRFKHGELMIRLWSPREVREIEHILSTLRRGRPKKQ